jgi:hypothetical protein
MYELQTTAGSAHGHAELVIALEDSALAEQGSYWISELDRRLTSGERFDVGRIPDLDGWPVCPVVRPDGALALHAHVLEDYRAGRTMVALDGHARLAQAQRQFATAFGAFEPPHWLMHVLVCPRWLRSADVLTRETPWANGSGWVIACRERRCSACAQHKRFHCPENEWLMIDIAELAVARPGLVRFLGLAPGHRIESPFERQRVDSFEVEYGHDIARLGAFTFGASHLLRQLAPMHAPERDVAIELDFAREAEVYDSSSSNDYFLVPALRERYGLNEAAANATYARARSPEVLRAYARWRVRDTLAPELFEVVEAVLEVPEHDRWKVINEAARKLVPITGKPFTAWKPIVEAFDKLLERAKVARR